MEAASVLVGEAAMLRRLRVTSTASEQRRMTAGHWPTKSGGEGGSKEQKFDQSPCGHRGHRGHRGHSCPRCGASSAQVPPVPPAGTPKWAGPGRTLPRRLVRPRSCAKRCDASRPLLMPFCHLESLPSPSPSGKLLRILPVPLRSQPSLCGRPPPSAHRGASPSAARRGPLAEVGPRVLATYLSSSLFVHAEVFKVRECARFLLARGLAESSCSQPFTE